MTEEKVPLRDSDGHPYPGDTFIYGAETIKLTKEQADLASQSSKLWIQGGTPTLPITDPETYAFGALRCATDNLNGDNVEWISYPPDDAHVFCFAYYVKPAPTSGTINVVKEVTLPTASTRSVSASRATSPTTATSSSSPPRTATPAGSRSSVPRGRRGRSPRIPSRSAS